MEALKMNRWQMLALYGLRDYLLVHLSWEYQMQNFYLSDTNILLHQKQLIKGSESIFYDFDNLMFSNASSC